MPHKGYKQTPAHKRKKALLVTGKRNGRWKGGRHYTTYRKLAGAKKGDGSIVHHLNSNRSDGRKANLQRLTDGKRVPGRRTTPIHEALTRRRSKGYKKL